MNKLLGNFRSSVTLLNSLDNCFNIVYLISNFLLPLSMQSKRAPITSSEDGSPSKQQSSTSMHVLLYVVFAATLR